MEDQSKYSSNLTLSAQPENPESSKKSSKKPKEKVARSFHDEFMSKYEEFSKSWREQLDREGKRGGGALR